MRKVVGSKGRQLLMRCYGFKNKERFRKVLAKKKIKLRIRVRVRMNRKLKKAASIKNKVNLERHESTTTSTTTITATTSQPLPSELTSNLIACPSQTLPSPTEELKSWPPSLPDIHATGTTNQKSNNDENIQSMIIDEDDPMQGSQPLEKTSEMRTSFRPGCNVPKRNLSNENGNNSSPNDTLYSDMCKLIRQQLRLRQLLRTQRAEIKPGSPVQRRPPFPGTSATVEHNIARILRMPLNIDDEDDANDSAATKEQIKRYFNIAVLDGRYLFIRKIEGTTFYYCVDAKSKKKLMCKVSQEPCAKLIEAYSRLNGHPYISQLHKVIRKDNKTYLFFPMLQDDLLSYVRKRKRLPERDARLLFRQICSIVRACHHNGIVLRDLKLRKFIFTDTFKRYLKLESLVDAVILEDPRNDLLREKRGCPVYVAPEILKTNQAYCGKAADMWSLGVILYTMLIGRYPFSDTEHVALFAKISRGQFILPDVISSKARCIVRCLLRQEPEERITSEDVFFHPWMNVCDTKEINLQPNDQIVPIDNFIGGEKSS